MGPKSARTGTNKIGNSGKQKWSTVISKSYGKQKAKGKKKCSPNIRKKAHATLGILRLDNYEYPPLRGDIDCKKSFRYQVHYKIVPGLTFSMCQKGKLPPHVHKSFVSSIRYLAEKKKVSGISSNCGFMMWYQRLARSVTNKPVFMSALAQLPTICCALSETRKIIIMTANGKALKPMLGLIEDECGVDVTKENFVIVGCEDVPGFEAVSLGLKVDPVKVQPGIIARAKSVLKKYPDAAAFVMECTELPPYSDAVRKATGLPVFDGITNCDFFIEAFKDNVLFGIQNWQKPPSIKR